MPATLPKVVLNATQVDAMLAKRALALEGIRMQ
jgi:hypothetical protein